RLWPRWWQKRAPATSCSASPSAASTRSPSSWWPPWRRRVAADWLDAWPGMRRDETLAQHSQYGIGGPADRFLAVRDQAGIEPLAELIRRCHDDAVPLTVIGAGSNTLILDGGIRGVVVKLSGRHLRVAGE